jgi:F-type H+-transporting ATPase subunit epsilon
LEKKFIKLKVITPNKILYEKNVKSVILRCVGGDKGILYGHEPCIAILDYGALQVYVTDKELDVLVVFGGIASIKDNTVTVISEMAALPDDIYKIRAEEDVEKALARISESKLDIDVRKAEIALRRSLVSRDGSAYPLIKSGENE